MVHFNQTPNTDGFNFALYAKEFNFALDNFSKFAAVEFKKFQETMNEKISSFFITVSHALDPKRAVIEQHIWVQKIEPNVEASLEQVVNRIKLIYDHLGPCLDNKVEVKARGKDNKELKEIIFEHTDPRVEKYLETRKKHLETRNKEYLETLKTRERKHLETREQISAPNQAPAETIKVRAKL